jgi:type I restriction enzyme S subunit
VRNSGNKIFISGLHTIIARAKTDELDNLYKEFCFQTDDIKAQFKYYAVGTKVTGISKTSIAKILLRFPSDKSEQAAIAGALSDVDTLIENIENLIVKKQAIKQGAMQELLTGKRRLPRFDGEWINTLLKTCFERIIGGGTPSRSNQTYWNGSIPWVTVKDFATFNKYTTQETISVAGLENSATNLIPKGTPIIATRIGLGQIFIYDVDVAINQDLKALFIRKEIEVAFIVYWFRYNKPLFESLGMGSTVKGISLEQLKNISIVVPPTKQEQTAIAAFLSDMDSEIEALTVKLVKTKLIKQGMMQELLSMRKRIGKKEENIIAFPSPKQKKTVASSSGHNQQFDDAIMIAGIVNTFYSDRYPLGRKKVQKLLYLLRRYQENSIAAFKKKAAGPYAHEVRYKGGERIARNKQYIETITTKGKGTIFKKGKDIEKSLEYIKSWGIQNDIQWLVENFLYTTGDKLELLATVDMAACDLKEAGTPVSVASVKHLIATNDEWKAKLQKIIFSDTMIAGAIADLKKLL